MFDRLGALRVGSRSPRRITLTLTRLTRVGGLALVVAGAWGALALGDLGGAVAAVFAGVIALGLAIFTLRRELDFDRDAGTVLVSNSVVGLTRREVVPLFHLRAVVVAHQSGVAGGYVAYLERRNGDDIFLDVSRRLSPLMKMADAISDVTELRVEYDATARMSDAG